ncbi:MAG: 3-keto-5-aminohexanoate cleavage protein [Candidatus Hermodarchaeota archaeon]
MYQDKSEKMIITATTANSWIYPNLKNWAENTDDLVDDVVKCCEAGAAIAHVHLPRGEEIEIVKKIRERCDIIIQAGMSSYPIENRYRDFQAKPDMLSVIANHHAEHFPEGDVNVIHDLVELEQYCISCKKINIKIEWEVWHTGSYWNLNYLITKGVLDPPYVLTLFFNWPGGTWSPPTADEYLHRIKYIPNDSIHTISVMGKEQTKIAVLAIQHGGNVRVGTEDYPFIKESVPAKNNAEIVARMVRISRAIGREIADPSEAREILGI